MKKFDSYPKSFKQTARFINQEANIEQVKGMERILSQIIYKRKQELLQKS